MELTTLGRLAELTDRNGDYAARAALADQCRAEGYSGVAITLAYVAGTEALMPHEVAA